MNTYVPLKTSVEIERLRVAAEALERVIAELGLVVRPGVTTHDLEQVGVLSLARNGLDSALIGYDGFPAAICTSVNNVAAHGVPGSRVLESGDIVTVDVAAGRDGWMADAAWTFAVGRLAPAARRIVRAAWRATMAGVVAARAGGRIGDIGSAVEREAGRLGCSVVREFTGHGIGRSLHEPPTLPNVASDGSGEPIVPGMVLNIEPVLTLGDGSVHLLDDGYSYATTDGTLAAQFEVTVSVRSDRTDILTLGRHRGFAVHDGPPY